MGRCGWWFARCPEPRALLTVSAVSCPRRLFFTPVGNPADGPGRHLASKNSVSVAPLSRDDSYCKPPAREPVQPSPSKLVRESRLVRRLPALANPASISVSSALQSSAGRRLRRWGFLAFVRRQLQVKTGGRVARSQLAQFSAAFSLTFEENLDDACASAGCYWCCLHTRNRSGLTRPAA